MAYQLQLKPFERKDGVKYKIIQITDVALHTTSHRPTSPSKKIRHAFAKNEPDRIYAPIGAVRTKDPTQEMKDTLIHMLQQDPAFIRLVQEEEQKGYKILIGIPEGGIPLSGGADTLEFMQSKNGKRVLRELAKKEKGV
ncbi:MAG: hypothetical protein PHV99_02645 [Candidatus Pacebacteria bacterium]|nr:hypothetical protein [Candidatus Paceibacterota bacterium]